MLPELKEYSTHKKLVTASKNKCNYKIIICTNDPDEWLLDWLHVQKKTGKLTYDSMIIAKDLPYRLKQLRKRGYKCNRVRKRDNNINN